MKPRPNAFPPLGLGWLLLAHPAGAASLTALGHLPAGSPSSRAAAVTSDGRFVVGRANSGAGSEAFRWSQAQGMTGLGNLPGGEFRSEAYAISADGGTVIGAAFSKPGLGFEPFRWTSEGGLKPLGSGLPDGFQAANALALTPRADVVVGSVFLASGAGRAYRWTTAAGYQLLPPPPGSAVGSSASVVSADGRIVAGVLEVSSSFTEGFRWTAETGMVGLGRQVGGQDVQTEVFGISADGRFITGLVYYVQSANIEMMRWSADEGLTPLGHFPRGESRSIGYGVSADGRLVVGEANMEVVQPGFPFPLVLPRAAVWRQGIGLRALWDLLVESGVNPALDGWESLFEAKAVSDDGRYVVGSGRRNGRTEAYLADLATNLEFTRSGDRFQLAWPTGFKLQHTATLSPVAWTDVAEAQSPWEVPAEGASRFYRLAPAP